MRTAVKRMLVLVLGTALSLGAVPAGAGADRLNGKKRVETEPYDSPSTAVALENAGLYAGNCNVGPTDHTAGCIYFDLKPRDQFISFEIEDLTGQPVFGIAWDDSNLDFAVFCGKTEDPVPSPGGEYIFVEVIATTDAAGCSPSTVTQGTVTATFSRSRK